MQEIHGPGHVPDTVPEELVAVYGRLAREVVRERRSRRDRIRARISRWIGTRDPLVLVVAAGLWTVVVAAIAASIALVTIH